MEALWNRYRIRTVEAAGAHLKGAQLIHSKELTMAIEAIQHIFQAPDIKTTASLFMKRYCAYIAVLEGMSRHNVETQLSLSQVAFSCSATHVFTYAPTLIVKKSKQNREAWRAMLVQSVFREHLSIMIEALERETRCSKMVMWSHIAYYIHTMYQRWLREEKDPIVRERLLEDFQYIQAAPPEWFGAHGQNPLAVSFCSMTHPVEEKSVFIRKACCLNYKTGTSKGACYTCPRLTEEQRLEKLQLAVSKA